jgi:hypothetical protein
MLARGCAGEVDLVRELRGLVGVDDDLGHATRFVRSDIEELVDLRALLLECDPRRLVISGSCRGKLRPSGTGTVRLRRI